MVGTLFPPLSRNMDIKMPVCAGGAGCIYGIVLINAVDDCAD